MQLMKEGAKWELYIPPGTLETWRGRDSCGSGGLTLFNLRHFPFQSWLTEIVVPVRSLLWR